MRTLTSDLFISLDGFALGEGAPAYFGYPGPELQRWIDAGVAEPQVVVLGRVTYQALAGYAAFDGDSAMATLPKIVFSRTLREPLSGNTRLVDTDLNEAIPQLKAESGDPLRTMGSITLVKNLLRRGLVDRLRLLVFPQILGATGREPIFPDLPDIDLDLVETRVLDSRIVVLEYRPNPPKAASPAG